MSNLFAEDLSETKYFPEFDIEEMSNSITNSSVDVKENLDIESTYIDNVVDKVLKEKRSIQFLNLDALYNLPVGLYDNIESPNYIVAIDSANIYPDYATFNAYLQIKLPFGNKILRFKSKETRFTFENGLEGPMAMELLDSESILITKGISLDIYKGTSATWGCDGFKEVNLIGQINFSDSLFIRVDSEGKEIAESMSVPINMVISSFNDFFLDFSMPYFKIKGFDEAFFEFEHVALDMSETNNPEQIKFPTDYPEIYDNELVNLWQGLFIKKATIALTNLKKENEVPILIGATDLIWDEYGLSCLVTADDIITLDEGSLGGWPYSLQHFELEFVAGDFKKAGLSGKLVPSGYSKETPLIYDAMFDVRGNYNFGVNIGKDLSFSLLMAKVNLESNSMINIEVNEGTFLPSADLYGDITLKCSQNSSNKKSFLSTPSLIFEGMHLGTVTPKFDVKYIELSGIGKNKMSGFPVTFEDFAFKNKDGYGYLSFNAIVNLKDSDDEGFGGSTNLSIVADTEDWQFHKVEVNHVHVEASKPGAFTIIGDVYFVRGDEVYGDGFGGSLKASFSKFAEIDASALFGKVNGYRYFYVDAMLTLSTGIPAGPLILYGFGGGLSYRMEQTPNDGSVPEFAQSISGLAYKPDVNCGIGIRAAVQMGVVKKELVQAEVSFRISFYNGGGIKQVLFTGEAALLSIDLPVDKEMITSMASKVAAQNSEDTSDSEPIGNSEMQSAPLRVRMSMLFDFENHVFHAENEVFINILGVITGIGDNNRAGWTVIHIASDEWYFYAGTPDDPVGLNFAGIAKTKSYFMTGYGIPDAMPMHPKVLEYLDMEQSEFEGNRQEGDIVLGKGIAFGSSFEFATGNLNFLMFYANFEMGFGFDIMLIQYPDKYYCKGHSQPMGIDHWYARGQSYVYFSGEIGIKVKLFMKKKKFTILMLQCAAAMRAEGPNPFWALGVVGGKYNVLGGLIKGSCKFQVEVGEKCELAASKSVSEQLADLEIISDISPSNDAADVNIFTLPQVAFNMPVGKQVKISEDENTSRYFKINLNKCVVTKVDGENAVNVSSLLEWNDDKTTVAISTDEIFSSNSKYKITAEVSFLEEVNGTWTPFKDDNGNTFLETKEVDFTTGDLPEEIPANLIAYSYPIDRMVNFYKDEYNKGYITFNRGVSVFFEEKDGWEERVRFTNTSNDKLETTYNYNSGNKSVEFSIPSNLKNDELFTLELMRIPVMGNKSIDRNISKQEDQVVKSDSTTVEITTTSIDGEIENAEEKSIYQLNFRCSKYNTLFEKLGIDKIDVTFLHEISPGIYVLGSTIYKDEMFDKFEIYGQDNIDPLIERSAKLDNADWYQNNVYPVLYEGYPFHENAQITRRNSSEVGIPPVADIRIWQTNFDKTLSDEEIEDGSFINPTEYSHFVYFLPFYWANDYQEIRNKLSNVYYELPKPDKVDYILKHPIWPQPSLGNYPIEIKYKLPGLDKYSSTKVIQIEDKIDVKQIDYEYEEDAF